MAVTKMPRAAVTRHVVTYEEWNALGARNRCDGRLTLTSATPVTTADVTAAGTIYFTPYKGNEIALYDATAGWVSYTFTERSLALTLTAANVYDVFIYNNAGTLTLETLIWTNATTRATALVTQDGVLCKTGALTRRYLGTIYASGTNTTEDSITKRYVFNYYNQVPRRMFAQETTASWTYASGTIRATNNASTCRLSFVIGFAEQAVDAWASATGSYAAANNFQTTIGLDSSTAALPGSTAWANVTAGGFATSASSIASYPGIGFHYLQQQESSPSTTTCTFYGSSTDRTSWIRGTIFA